MVQTKSLLIGIVFGVLLAITVHYFFIEDNKESTEIQVAKVIKELENKKLEVVELRVRLASERRLSEKAINESLARYDSIENLSKARDKKYKDELNRLKTFTIKQLEDEAEEIYRRVMLADSTGR